MSKPIEIHCLWLFSPAILTGNSHQQFLTRYFHLWIFCGIATSSSPSSKYSMVHITGKSIHILSTDDLKTFKPLAASASWLSSPFRVFILMVVFSPSSFNFLARSILMKVSWLQQSNMAWVLNSFLSCYVLFSLVQHKCFFKLWFHLSCSTYQSPITHLWVATNCDFVFLTTFIAM